MYFLVTSCLRAGMTNMGPRAGEGPPSQAGRAIHWNSGDFLPPRSFSFASSFLVFVNLIFNYRHFGLLSMEKMTLKITLSYTSVCPVLL